MPSGRRHNRVSIEDTQEFSSTPHNNASSLGGVCSDIFSKADCTKIVNELNREVSLYCSMVTWLGSSKDSDCLRADLRDSRHRAFNLAHHVKLGLLPHLDSDSLSDDRYEVNALWTIYVLCLDMLENQIRRTVQLLIDFPFHRGLPVLINTGVVDTSCECPVQAILSSQLGMSLVDGRELENEEVLSLKSEVCELHDMVAELHRIDIKKWSSRVTSTYQEQVFLSSSSTTLNCRERPSAVGGATPDGLGSTENHRVSTYNDGSLQGGDVVSVDGSSRLGHRRCLCWISSFIISVVLFSAVLGICVALFGHT